MDQKSLVKLVEDLRYVVQSGGAGANQTGGGAFGTMFLFFISIIKGIFVLIIYCVLLYILYILIFKSYPRFAYDLATLSFFKKQNLDLLFTENEFMFNHYKFFLKKDNEFAGVSPFMLSKIIYNYNTANPIENLVKDVENHINTHYKAFKFTKRYSEAFREYYLFHGILTPKPITETDPCKREKCVELYEEQLANPNWQPPLTKAPMVERLMSGTDQRPLSAPFVPRPPEKFYVIKHFNFYEKMVELQKRSGALQTRNTEYFPSIAEFQYKDKVNNYAIYNRVYELRQKLDVLGKECANLVKLIDAMPVSWFVAIPANLDDRTTVSVEILNNYDNAITGSLYSSSTPAKLSDYTWYVLEVMKRFRYDDLKRNFESLIGGQPYEATLVLTAYINLPMEKRKSARRTLLASHSNINITSATLQFMNRYPIFCNLYFNTRANVLATGRSSIYENVISTYRTLMTTSKTGPALNLADKTVAGQALQNLIFNGRHFKQWVNSVYVMNMFLNTYKTTMISQYEEQLLSDVKFFQALFDPFKNELVHRRIIPYSRRVLSGKNWSKSFRNFVMLWKLLGTLIKRIKSMISSSFSRGISMPADEAPPQDGSAADSG